MHYSIQKVLNKLQGLELLKKTRVVLSYDFETNSIDFFKAKDLTFIDDMSIECNKFRYFFIHGTYFHESYEKIIPFSYEVKALKHPSKLEILESLTQEHHYVGQLLSVIVDEKSKEDYQNFTQNFTS